MGEKHSTTSDSRKEGLSALESINASFAELKEQAARGNTSLDSYKRQTASSSTLEKINASFAAAQKEAGRSKGQNSRKSQVDFMWNVITGVLVTAMIVATVIFVIVIRKGSTPENPSDQTQPVQTTESQTVSTEPPSETASESQTETESASATETESERQTEQENVSREIPEEYASILSDDEKKEWESRQADSSRLFVQINQKLNAAEDGNVYLRLVNPPYSAFNIQIKVYIQDAPDTVLYQSDIMEPGNILEYAEFDNLPEPGEYTAGVEYTVYGSDGNKIGTHEVAVDLTVQTQQAAAGE